eukprot:evm.model.scf_1110.3 EVM.evm.TU.scf_1110.3   scf_1110:24694-26571(-)
MLVPFMQDARASLPSVWQSPLPMFLSTAALAMASMPRAHLPGQKLSHSMSSLPSPPLASVQTGHEAGNLDQPVSLVPNVDAPSEGSQSGGAGPVAGQGLCASLSSASSLANGLEAGEKSQEEEQTEQGGKGEGGRGSPSSQGEPGSSEGPTLSSEASDHDMWAPYDDEDEITLSRFPPLAPLVVAKGEGFVDFRRLASLEEVENEIRELGDAVEGHHLAAAFNRLKQMQIGADLNQKRVLLKKLRGSFLEELSHMMIKYAHKLSPRNVVAVIHACAKLRYVNCGLLEVLSKEMLRKKSAKVFYSMELANLVYSLGVLAKTHAFLSAAHLGNLEYYRMHGPKPVAPMFASQGRLLRDIAKEMTVSHRLTDFKTQELANTVYGFALLDFRDDHALVAISRELLSPEHQDHFEDQEISNIVYGFGLLGYRDEYCIMALLNGALTTGKLATFLPQHVANILYGLAKLGFRYDKFLEAAMERIVHPQDLAKFREQELANLTSCLAVLGVKDPQIFAALVSEITKRRHMQRFTVQNLSSIVLGLAEAGHRDVDALNCLAEEIVRPRRMAGFSPRDLVDIIQAFDKLQFHHQGFFLALAAELRKPHRASQASRELWQVCRGHLMAYSFAFPF